MKRLAALVTFGVCAISVKASAEPRATSSASHAKTAPTSDVDLLAGREDTAYAEIVATADADGDEQVTSGELLSVVRRYVQRQVAARFARLDRNRDGLVTRSEVPSMVAARFARFDSDASGAFTAIELDRVMQQQAASRCRAVFARLDVDRDGELSMLDAGGTRSARVSSR
jgi:Ca2+-binding EF-hand superfamily protein